MHRKEGISMKKVVCTGCHGNGLKHSLPWPQMGVVTGTYVIIHTCLWNMACYVTHVKLRPTIFLWADESPPPFFTVRTLSCSSCLWLWMHISCRSASRHQVSTCWPRKETSWCTTPSFEGTVAAGAVLVAGSCEREQGQTKQEEIGFQKGRSLNLVKMISGKIGHDALKETKKWLLLGT